MDNELPAPNPPAVNNVEAYLAMLNGVEDLPMPATINNNVEYYLRKLVEGGVMPAGVVDNIWFGSQAEFDLIDPKAEKTLYLIKEESAALNTLNLSSPRSIETPITPSIDTPKVTLNRDINVEDNPIEETVEEPEIEEEPEETEIEEQPEEEE